MTHDELREVVARAIIDAYGADPNDDPNGGDYIASTAAIAAIRAALEEPDEAMIDAGVEASQWQSVSRIYRACIAASPLADPAARDDGEGVG